MTKEERELLLTVACILKKRVEQETYLLSDDAVELILALAPFSTEAPKAEVDPNAWAFKHGLEST